MRHNSSFGVRFLIIVRGRRLLINLLLKDAFKWRCMHAKIIQRHAYTCSNRKSAKTPRSVTQGIDYTVDRETLAERVIKLCQEYDEHSRTAIKTPNLKSHEIWNLVMQDSESDDWCRRRFGCPAGVGLGNNCLKLSRHTLRLLFFKMRHISGVSSRSR